MAITSREELALYAKRKLGWPVTEINVDEKQVEERIDDAIQMFQEFNTNGQTNILLKHQITSSDITNEYITLDDNILYVRDILQIPDGENSLGYMFNYRYQIHLNDIYDLNFAGSLYSYVQTMQYISLLEMEFGAKFRLEFERLQNKLYMEGNWSELLSVDDYIVLDCIRTVDPTVSTRVYDERWVKAYVTALIKKQWGQNLMKFEGMQLPGGVTINSAQIFDAALAEIEQLEDELRTTYEDPIDFFVG